MVLLQSNQESAFIFEYHASEALVRWRATLSQVLAFTVHTHLPAGLRSTPQARQQLIPKLSEADTLQTKKQVPRGEVICQRFHK